MELSGSPSFGRAMFRRLPPNFVVDLQEPAHKHWLEQTGLTDFVRLVPWDSSETYAMARGSELVQKFIIDFDPKTSSSFVEGSKLLLSDEFIRETFHLPPGGSGEVSKSAHGYSPKSFTAPKRASGQYGVNSCTDQVVRERLSFVLFALHMRSPNEAPLYHIRNAEEPRRMDWGKFLRVNLLRVLGQARKHYEDSVSGEAKAVDFYFSSQVHVILRAFSMKSTPSSHLTTIRTEPSLHADVAMESGPAPGNEEENDSAAVGHEARCSAAEPESVDTVGCKSAIGLSVGPEVVEEQRIEGGEGGVHRTSVFEEGPNGSDGVSREGIITEVDGSSPGPGNEEENDSAAVGHEARCSLAEPESVDTVGCKSAIGPSVGPEVIEEQRIECGGHGTSLFQEGPNGSDQVSREDITEVGPGSTEDLSESPIDEVGVQSDRHGGGTVDSGTAEPNQGRPRLEDCSCGEAEDAIVGAPCCVESCIRLVSILLNENLLCRSTNEKVEAVVCNILGQTLPKPDTSLWSDHDAQIGKERIEGSARVSVMRQTTVSSSLLKTSSDPARPSGTSLHGIKRVANDPPTTGQKMRRTKNYWTSDEVHWLNQGVERYGVGKWKKIKQTYWKALVARTTVDLKDKWRSSNGGATKKAL